MFLTDVAKVYQNVARVAKVVHVRCKLMFSMFHLFFFDICCKCVYMDVAYVFTHMLQMFYQDVGFKCFEVFL